LALNALQDGVVDFTDKRVKMRGASIDIGKGGGGLGNSGKYTNKELFEVDLGELKSLRKDEIHLDELKHDSNY